MGASDGTKLFSILPPKSILADTSGADTLKAGKNARSDSLLVDSDRYQSLTGAMSSSDLLVREDRDADSVFSEPSRSRNVRPFSPQPQPLRLNPEDLLGSLEDAAAGESSSAGLARGGSPGNEETRESDEEGAIEDDGRAQDDEEAHPWRNEGLRSATPSKVEDQDKTGASLEDPQQREETWSVTDGST